MDKAEKALIEHVIGQLRPGGGASSAVVSGCQNIEMSDSATLLRAESAGNVGIHDLQCLNHLLLLPGPVPSAPSRTTHFLLFINNYIIYS